MAKKKVSVKSYPERAADVPVTQRMLYLVRDGLEAKIDGTGARFDNIDVKIARLDAKFDQVDAKFVQLDAKIDGFRFEIKTEIHRLALLVEEQNARNAIVLDGLTNLFTRQEGLESRFEKEFGK